MTWLFLLGLAAISMLLWRHQGIFVPLAWLVSLLIGDLMAFFLIHFGIELAWVRRLFLLGAVLIGFIFVMQSIGKYQIYYLKWGPRPLTLETYLAFAETIRSFLWLKELPPATVAFDPQGRLTFDQNSSPFAKELMIELEDDLNTLDRQILIQNSQVFILIHFLVMGLILLTA